MKEKERKKERKKDRKRINDETLTKININKIKSHYTKPNKTKRTRKTT